MKIKRKVKRIALMAIEFLNNGYTYKETAYMVGFSSASSLSNYLRSIGYTKRSRGLTSKVRNIAYKAANLLEEGYKYKDVARMLGFKSIGTLSGYLSTIGYTKTRGIPVIAKKRMYMPE